ncbi:MAG: purine-binding chemotaxis protein CheW [Candidatus Melainabacteria bacterium]|nr:purine-binding chemotaxis protein CheW [Candidatus Melainabacteria bacterium]
MTTRAHHLVAFSLDQQRFAIQLAVVQRVVQAVEITPLPKAPSVVMGIINVQGQVIPVLNIRKRFRLPDKDINLVDYLIIAATTKRKMAFLVDDVIGIVAHQESDVTKATDIASGIDYVEGVLRLPDGMILIHNLDEFFSFAEAKSLDLAMKAL